ncbi:hypothetical protein SPRG_04797 [Saprolegnia parasitica CBS 223.65]|uniref:Uncharacterized protein n=1 Tax=Saprolegnia parasitica (strain CBS 223.65) TaxID=695850 RepID=A0A067CJH7_SAPPC|nr:hypothetical protein SPRG_04797 [Saprolegnia parasitica CBS 223.65]KDO30894.1 hypothetical protein SPRG_04797 [Saprolegnia parasitica CBS 223.65]|eukprot:XP_012198588.1 hypothetical protein SPRG_04797 [Saprolegnia parasitica CBS 223.65]
MTKVSSAWSQAAPPRPSKWAYLVEYGGILYVLSSVLLGVYGLALLSSYTQNDNFWPDYTQRNTSSTLTDVVNGQLRLRASLPSTDLTSLTVVLSSDASGSPHTYARQLLYHELTSPDYAIQGLRTMPPSHVTSLVSQYCWVDWHRNWSVAHSSQRAARCSARYQANAATYLESVLRNIPFDAWHAIHGDYYEASIARPMIASSLHGAAWVSTIASHTWLPQADESILWHAKGLHHFTLAYANNVQVGLQETIDVTNALGQRHATLLKAVPLVERGSFGSSIYLYGGLLYDFEAVGANGSLVRNTSNFRSDAAYIQYYVVGTPLSPAQSAVHSQIGPLGSIDMTWVPPPLALLASVELFRSSIGANLAANAVFRTAFLAMGSGSMLHPTPTAWRNDSLRFLGGSPLCGHGAPVPFVQESFGFDDGCGTQKPLTLHWTPLSSLFAAVMLRNTSRTSLCDLCNGPDVYACEARMASTTAAITAIPGFAIVAPTTVIEDLNISLFQFVSADKKVWLETLPILTPDFAVAGWMALYDWALGDREVVLFEGDVDDMALISSTYTLLSRPPASDLGNVGVYLWSVAVYISVVLTVVSLVLILLWAQHRPLHCSWWYFHRIVASVWLSKSLLVVRGLTAVLCLATTPLVPSHDDVTSSLSHAPRSLLVSAVLASEVTWTLYVLHELAHPMTQAYTRTYAPISISLAWLLTMSYDFFAPLDDVAIRIQRSCSHVSFGYVIHCQSARLAIGSYARFTSLLVAHLALLVLCVLLARANRRRHAACTPSTGTALLPTMAAAFLWSEDASAIDLTLQNVVTGAMCGLFSVCGQRRVFDIKLWRFFESTQLQRGPSLGSCILSSKRESLPMCCKYSTLNLVLGFAYLALTLCNNALYLDVADETFANDFGWRGFSTARTYPFLGNLFNTHLLTTSFMRFQLDNASLGDLTQTYNASSALLKLFRHTAINDAIANLRHMDPCKLPWMFTQYCWLDLGQTWSMASTAARQARCGVHSTNGARYLETGLRNLRDVDAWDACWGSSFAIGFGDFLATSQNGQRWLSSTLQPYTLSVDDEATHWAAHGGIATFELQWQNYKALGFDDALTIWTALGLGYTLPLSAIAGVFRRDQQTSLRMYWSFAADLWAIASNKTCIGGRSLVRSSAQFAFANATTPESLLLENLTLAAPLSPGLAMLAASLGPFGAVDMVYVLPPAPLRRLYELFTALLSQYMQLPQTNTNAFFKLPVRPAIAEASSWLLSGPDTMLVGGNLLCGDDLPPFSARNGIDLAFSVDNLCHAVFLDYMHPGTIGLLFSLFGHTSTSYSDSDVVNVESICTLDAYRGLSCADDYQTLLAFLMDEVQPPPVFASLAIETQTTVRSMNIEMIQYLYRNMSATTPLELYRINLLDMDDVPWRFYGWCFLYEWVTGAREVVSFQGDVSTISTISARANPTHLSPDPRVLPTYLSLVFRDCLIGITCSMTAVALLLVLYAIRCQGRIEGLNLLEVNRIVGIVWIGRPFLLLRGITAIMLLNTSPLYLEERGGVTRMATPPLPWHNTIVAASEATWLVYVLNDLFSCVTRQYTTVYAYKSTLLTWAAVATYTFLQPHVHAAEMTRRCIAIEMDSALRCNSGYIEIGNGVRFWKVIAICCSSILVCYGADRLWQPRLPDVAVPSLLLSAQSVYLLTFDRWIYDGDYYLDRTSAVMAGLVSVNWRGSMLILDIKAWRVHIVRPLVSLDPNQPKRFRHAIPLQCIGAE